MATAGVLLAGCAHEEPPPIALSRAHAPAARAAAAPSAVGVTNAQAPSIDPIFVAQVASARCDREDACGEVGDGRRYSSLRSCLDQVRDGITSEVASYGCPGAGETAVRRCLVAMGRQDCGAPGEQALSHVEECAVGALCTPSPGGE